MTKKRQGRDRKLADLKAKSGKQIKAEQVRGGRAGGDKVKYMEVKLKEVFIAGV